jgi:Glyoxalase/Bleomycin resistance protein/Dioxygenase superfamily
MREPVLNETVQLGILVRDLEATIRRYVDDYGIGPWQFAQIDAGDANNYREYGRPVERSTRIAVATVGRVMSELIEPLDEDGNYARFLAEKGEGIHPSVGRRVLGSLARRCPALKLAEHVSDGPRRTLPTRSTFRWMPLYPVSQYYRQGKPMEGESRWES